MDNWLSYYYPSTVVFVDDQQAFLTAIKNRLPKQILALFYNDAATALNKIKTIGTSQHTEPQYFQEIVDDVELDMSKNTEAYFNIKLGDISKMSYNAQRFAEISVVIVDQMMPDLDGISFCRELINYPVKKIMLTASKDLSIATKAFNEGIIDFFLLKDSPDLISELLSEIKNKQMDYFYSLNDRTLGFSVKKIASAIHNPNIYLFLQDKLKELNVEEFYLLDRYGSMLFVQHDGTPVTLAILPGEVIENFAGIAQEHEETTIALSLSKKEKLLFFPKEIDCMRPVKEWEAFLFDAKRLPQTANLFYSLITDTHSQPIDVHHLSPQKNYSQLF